MPLIAIDIKSTKRHKIYKIKQKKSKLSVYTLLPLSTTTFSTTPDHTADRWRYKVEAPKRTHRTKRAKPKHDPKAPWSRAQSQSTIPPKQKVSRHNASPTMEKSLPEEAKIRLWEKKDEPSANSKKTPPLQVPTHLGWVTFFFFLNRLFFKKKNSCPTPPLQPIN